MVVLLCIFSLPVSWGGLSPPCTPSWDTSGNGCWSRCVGFACTAWKLRWSCKDKLVKNRVIRLHKSSPRGRIPCLAHPAVSADGCRCQQGDSGLPHHKAAMPLGFDCSAGRGLLAGAEEWSVDVQSHCPVPRLLRRGWPWAGFPSAHGSGCSLGDAGAAGLPWENSNPAFLQSPGAVPVGHQQEVITVEMCWAFFHLWRLTPGGGCGLCNSRAVQGTGKVSGFTGCPSALDNHYF